MSWSISVIGKPENVVAEIERESAKQTGQSKVEFDDAMPHLIGLVNQTFTKAANYQVPIIKLDASGSGMSEGGEQKYRNCTVKIEPIYTKLV